MHTLHISVGSHETPNALILALQATGINIDPIVRGLWREVRVIHPARTIALEVETAQKLGVGNQRYRSALAAFPTWRTTFCPAETVAQLALQHREWTNVKRIVIIMECLRFSEMMNDGYAYAFSLHDGKISAVNVHSDATVPDDTVLVTVIS